MQSDSKENQDVFLLVDDFRLFKYTRRATHHFSHLHQPSLELKSANASLLTSPCQVGTKLHFVYKHYRAVFVLDASPSLALIDSALCKVLFETLFESVTKCLTVMVQTLILPCAKLDLGIFVSVVTQDASSSPVKFLLQAQLVNRDNLTEVLTHLKSSLDELEHGWAKSTSRLEQERRLTRKAEKKKGGQLGRVGIEEKGSRGTGVSRDLQDRTSIDLRSLLQNGMFALARMPDSACPLMILVTDGVLSLPEKSGGGYDDGMLSQLIQQDISVSVLQITSSTFRNDFHFGYVPDSDMMKFLSRYTGGMFCDLEELPSLLSGENGESCFQQQMFIRRSALTKSTWEPVNKADIFAYAVIPRKENFGVSKLRVKHYSLNLDVHRLIECRAGEGFKNAHFKECTTASPSETVAFSQLRMSITLLLEWKHNIFIEYTFSFFCLPPIAKVELLAESQVDIEIHVTADPEFLAQLATYQAERKANRGLSAVARKKKTTVVADESLTKLWSFVVEIVKTDAMLRVLNEVTQPTEVCSLQAELSSSFSSPSSSASTAPTVCTSSSSSSYFHSYGASSPTYSSDGTASPYSFASPSYYQNSSSSTPRSMSSPISPPRLIGPSSSDATISSAPSFALNQPTPLSFAPSNATFASPVFARPRRLSAYHPDYTSPEHSLWKIVRNYSSEVWRRWFHILNLELLCCMHEADVRRANSQIRALSFSEGGRSSGEDIALGLQRLDHGVSDAVYTTLASWCSVVLAEDLFVAFLPSPTEGHSRSTSFCLIRTSWPTKFLANIQLGFFATNPEIRYAVMETLKWRIASAHVTVTSVELGKGGSEPPNFSEDGCIVFPDEGQVETMGLRISKRLVKPFGFTDRGIVPILLQPAQEDNNDKASEKGAGAVSPSSTTNAQKNLSLRLLRSYMRHHTWTWTLSSPESATLGLRIIRALRTEEGFVLVSSNRRSTSWLREISLSQVMSDRAVVSIIQFAVVQTDAHTLQTELWMEPHFGYYNVSDGKMGESKTQLHSAKLFDAIESWLHSCDLHVISALTTFDAIRDIEFDSPGEKGLQPSALGLLLELKHDFRFDPAFSYHRDSFDRFHDFAVFEESGQRAGGTGLEESKKLYSSFKKRKPMKEKAKEKNGTVPLTLTYLLECSVAVPMRFLLPTVPLESEKAEEVDKQRRSFNTLLGLSVNSMRVMSDLELIYGRVFGQLFNEYTLLFFLLPRPCQLSTEADETEPLDRYLDNLLASFFVGTAPVSPVEFPPSKVSKLDHYLPILIFVCSRDHLGHPKTLPAVLCTPPIDIPMLDPTSSEGSLAAAIAAAVESGKLHCGLSDGRPAEMKSAEGKNNEDILNLNAVIASVFASSLVFAELSHALPPVPVSDRHEAKYQPTETVQPHLPVEDAPFSGLAVSESLQSILTEDTKLYVFDFFHRFRTLNHRNFVTGLYLNLVEQLPIAPVDWLTALQTCVEYTTEVDISLVQVPEGVTVDRASSERLTSKINALISSRFHRYGDTNYSYYVPPEISKEVSEDEDFPAPSTDDTSNPFFLRLEVEAAGNPIRVPVRPDTFLDKIDPNRNHQSKDNNFASGQVLLRLNCVSLSPISVLFDSDVKYSAPDPVVLEASLGNVSNNSLNSLGSAGKQRRELRIKVESQRNFKPQREGIPRINSRRRWPQKSSLSNLLSVSDTRIPELEDPDLSDDSSSDEVSESPEPARTRPLKSSQSMINLSQLEPRLPFPQEELNAAVTPQYTFDQLPQHIAVAMEKLKSDLQALVAEEILLRLRTRTLSELNVATGILAIIRDQMNRLPDGALFTETIHLNFVPSIIQMARALFPSELALHPLQFKLIQLDDGPVLVADRPYWLILVLTADAVHVCSHVSSLSQDEIQSMRKDVRAAVEETCEKINQTCLLASLNETRAASDLLIAYDPERDRDIPQDEDDSPTKIISTQRTFPVRSAWPLEEPGLYSRPPFQSGQFACPCVLSLRFSLHDRLKSELALQSIALFPLIIGNRRNVYLYKEQTSGHVFYFILSPQPLHQDKDEAYAVFGQVPWESTRWLYLDVFGVNPPSEEIREQLAALVLSRLNDLSLKCIHNLLALNPLFKLLPVDHQFIRPPSSAPLRSLLFPLAFAGTTLEVKDPYLYMLYLKQNVKFLNQLCLAQSESKSASEGTFKPTDFFFVHHIYGEKQKALGLSTVYFSLLRQNCAGPVCDLPTNPVDSLNVRQEFSNNSALRITPQPIVPVIGGISSARDEEQAEHIWDIKPDQEALWYLVVEVWSRGQVDLDELFHMLTESVNLALHDYMIETLLYCHRALPKEPILEKLPSSFAVETLNPCLALLQSAQGFSAPAVHRLEVDLPLCKWSLPRLMREFRNIVFGLNAQLNPVSFVGSVDTKAPTELLACKSEAGEVVSLLQKKPSSFVLLGGFDFGQIPSTAGEDSGQSDDSDRDEDFKKPEQSRGVVLEPKRAHNEMLTPGFSNPKHLYHRHLTYPCQRVACGRRQTGSFKERGKEGGVHIHALARNSVAVFSVFDRPRKVVIWTYNMQKGTVDRLAEDLSALTSWFLARQALCFNILHQKMGLFHHSNPTHPRRSMVLREVPKPKFRDLETTAVISDIASSPQTANTSLAIVTTPIASPTSLSIAATTPSTGTHSTIGLSVSLKPSAHPAQSPPPSPGSSTSSLSLSHKFRLNNIRFFVEPTGPGRAKKEVIPSSPKVIASPSPPVLARGGVLAPGNMRSYLQMRNKVQRPGALTTVTPEKKEENPKIAPEDGATTPSPLSHVSLIHILANPTPFHLEFGSLLRGLYPQWDTWDTLMKESGKDFKSLDFSSFSPFASPYSRYSPHSPLSVPQSLLFSDVIDPFQFHGRQLELLVAARTQTHSELQQNEENFAKWQPIAAGLQKDMLPSLHFLPDVCTRARPLQVIRVPLVFSDGEASEEASLSAVLVSYQRDYTQYLDHQLQAHVIDIGRMDPKPQPFRKRTRIDEIKVEEGFIEMRGAPTAAPTKVLMFKVVGGHTVFLQINFEFCPKKDDEPKVHDIFTCLNLSIAPFPRLMKAFEQAWKSISRGQVTLRQNRDLKKNSMAIGAEALQQDFINGIISSCESLHINSLTYDFHLRHILNCVLDSSSIYPEFDLKEALTTFARFYPAPPSHSRNTLIHRKKQMTLPAELGSQSDFFAYITKHASLYGVNDIPHRRHRNAVFCIASSTNGDYFGDLKLNADPDTDSSGGGPSSLGFCSLFSSKYVYLMLVFLWTTEDIPPSDLLRLSFDDSCDKGHFIPLEYFLIQVDRTSIFPRSQFRSNTPDSTLESIFAAGETALKRKLCSAFTHYQRDEVWSRIVNSHRRTASNVARKSLSPFHGNVDDNACSELKDFSEFDYEIFRSLTLRRPLDVVDGSLSNLTSVGMSDLGSGLGRPLFDYLCKLYGTDCHLLTFQGWRHLFIACRHDKDVILHVIIHMGPKTEGRRGAFATMLESDCGQCQFKVFVCRRVFDLPRGLESMAEKEMVEYFTNHVCHFLWEQMVHWLVG